MCTAILYKNGDAYFGRNLDLERGYGEQVIIAPRNFPFPLRRGKAMERHYAMIGMAAITDGFPLYFDATNEKGLSMAGLNFPGNAVYFDHDSRKYNITPFELIPWILGKCATVEDAKALLHQTNLLRLPFSEQLPLSPLHWMVSDKQCSLVVESTAEGLRVYNNPFDVLTNNPPFPYHCMNMNNYMGLHPGPAKNRFPEPLHNYSLGMGALGLPGDFSSASRFVRVCFVKDNSVCEQDEGSNVHQFFHILNSVAMPKGCVEVNGLFEYTRYSSCCNADKGIYYYTTYDDLAIRSLSMKEMDLEQSSLYCARPLS